MDAARRLSPLSMVVGLLLLAACGPGAGLEPPPDTVLITDFSYRPPELRVTMGTTVTWSNQETGTTHTVTARDRAWDSGLLQPGEFHQVTFEEPGTFEYFCSIHPQMEGTITVDG